MMPSSVAYSLEGKHALVCGSTQGIGRACALEIARLGARVTLMARNKAGLEKVKSELAAEHGQSHGYVVADFTQWQQVRDRVNEHVNANGPVHILLNNTGGPPAGPVFEARAEELIDAFALHLLCNQVLVQAVVPGMQSAAYGRIVNIVSTSVVQTIQGLGVSNTIRGAVANWARTLAGELGPHGITVNNVLPGYTSTARLNALIQGRANRAGCTVDEIERGMKATVPLRRFAAPEEIAAVAGFLASPAASYVNGLNLPVDGGRLAVQ